MVLDSLTLLGLLYPRRALGGFSQHLEIKVHERIVYIFITAGGRLGLVRLWLILTEGKL